MKYSNHPTEVYISKKYFPDNVFRSYLRETYADSDGKIDTDDVGCIELNCKGVKTLSGVELFKHLSQLSCAGNEISNINLNYNTELKELDCSDNKLNALDVSNCKMLDILKCASNIIHRLDVSAVAPRYVDCSDNSMIRLDIGENKRLEELHCRNNHLMALNITPCTSLDTLDADEEVRPNKKSSSSVPSGTAFSFT